MLTITRGYALQRGLAGGVATQPPDQPIRILLCLVDDELEVHVHSSLPLGLQQSLLLVDDNLNRGEEEGFKIP